MLGDTAKMLGDTARLAVKFLFCYLGLLVAYCLMTVCLFYWTYMVNDPDDNYTDILPLEMTRDYRTIIEIVKTFLPCF